MGRGAIPTQKRTPRAESCARDVNISPQQLQHNTTAAAIPGGRQRASRWVNEHDFDGRDAAADEPMTEAQKTAGPRRAACAHRDPHILGEAVQGQSQWYREASFMGNGDPRPAGPVLLR